MRITPNGPPLSRRTRRTEPIIIFLISGQVFAINANAIDEIRSTDSTSAAATEIFEPSVPKVRHLLHRGASTMFVVNGCAHFGFPSSRTENLVLLRNSRVALLVESIERMATMFLLMPLPPGFSGAERLWYRGITLISEDVVPVINPLGFLTEEEVARLDSAASSSQRTAPQVLESRGGLAPEQSQ